MDRSSLISAAEDVLRQGIALLDSIDEDTYSRKEEGPWGSSIGAHYRHVLDHFLCLIEGLWDFQINYDHRSRDREIETSVEVARSTTQELFEALPAFPMRHSGRDVRSTYSVSMATALHRASHLSWGES